jgi:hypothetical protein
MTGMAGLQTIAGLQAIAGLQDCRIAEIAGFR